MEPTQAKSTFEAATARGATIIRYLGQDGQQAINDFQVFYDGEELPIDSEFDLITWLGYPMSDTEYYCNTHRNINVSEAPCPHCGSGREHYVYSTKQKGDILSGAKGNPS